MLICLINDYNITSVKTKNPFNRLATSIITVFVHFEQFDTGQCC